MTLSIQDWIALISALVAFLSLLVTLLRSMRSQAKQDGKTTEVLRQVNDKLENISRQEAANSARIEAIVERVVVVEQSAKQAHFRIDELRDEMHK